MLDALRLYGRLVSISLRGQMQYRVSFILFCLANLLLTFLQFFAVWVLFERFGHIKGWRLAEVALFYGMAHMAFALAEIIGGGFQYFSFQVRQGNFDQVLLRPRCTVLQIMGQRVQIGRIGRFLQGLSVLLWGAFSLEMIWTWEKIALLVAAVFSGACLFWGFFILLATLCFWTIQFLQIMLILGRSGVEAAQFPLSVYHPWFRRFFTFVIPLACITYYPGLAIFARADPLGSSVYFQWSAPAIGFLFLLLSLQVWKTGVRHYCSTGS